VLTSHKNALFAAVRNAGLDTALFETQELEPNGFIVRLKQPPLEFELLHSPTTFERFRCRCKRFAPGLPYMAGPIKGHNTKYHMSEAEARELAQPEPNGWIPRDNWWDLSRILDQFETWLDKHVKRAVSDLAQPDLWSNTATVPNVYEGAPSTHAEDRFTPAERDQIRLAVAQFRIRIVEDFSPDAEQTENIDRRLDYLAAAADRLNRFDWTALAVSTVIGVATTLSLDTAAGRELWEMFRDVFHAVAHLLGG
jgi:hypothetical protein